MSRCRRWSRRAHPVPTAPIVSRKDVAISTDTKADIAQVVEQTQEYYDGPADEIYRRLWRDNVHMGTWRHAEDTIDTAMARTNHIMAERAGVRPGSELLDVGSGYGASARFLAERYGCWVTGINISPRENELAEQRNRAAGLDERIEIRYGDFHELPFEDGQFEVVWTQESLLHAADKHRVLEECQRVLEPGGRFVLSDLLVRSSLPDEERERIYQRVRSPGMWDLDEYVEAMEAAGFAIEDRDDWPENVAPTYQSVLEQLVEQREALAGAVPYEQIESTIAALELWVSSAQAGKISQGFVVGERPE